MPYLHLPLPPAALSAVHLSLAPMTTTLHDVLHDNTAAATDNDFFQQVADSDIDDVEDVI